MNTVAELLALAKLSAPVRRELTVVPRVLDDKAGTVEFVASDETLDCYQEIVKVSGWKFTHFAKNAPFVDSHDYSTIEKLLGQVQEWRIEKNQLVETVRYDLTEGSLGLKAFKLVRDGFLKAVSVGFVPVRAASKWDSTSTDFVNAVAELKLDAQTAAKLRVVYLEQEQIELSQCIIGANPNALAKSCQMIAQAYKGGCLTEQDINQLSAAIAASKNASSAADSADAGQASPRTKLAIMAAITAHL